MTRTASTSLTLATIYLSLTLSCRLALVSDSAYSPSTCHFLPVISFLLSYALSGTLRVHSSPEHHCQLMYSIVPQKRTHRAWDNIYIGDEQPTPVTCGTVHVAVAGTQKRARVVTKTFGLRQSGTTNNSNTLAPEKDICAQATNATGEGEVELDSQDKQDLPPKKVISYYLQVLMG